MFRSAKFRGAMFRGAKFRGDNVPGSKVPGSKDPGFKVPGAKFRGAKFLEPYDFFFKNLNISGNTEPSLTNLVLNESLGYWLSIGCKFFHEKVKNDEFWPKNVIVITQLTLKFSHNVDYLWKYLADFNK